MNLRGRKWGRDVTVHIGRDGSLQNSKYFPSTIRCVRWKPLGYDCVVLFSVSTFALMVQERWVKLAF